MSETSRLEELLDRWEEAFEAGQEITAEALCQDCPELLPLLTARIEKLRAVEGRLQQWNQILPFARDDTPATHDDPAPVEAVTRYDQLNRYAQGGLGIVYKALDQQLNRPVALKFIQARWKDDTISRQRFLLEAEITGRLEHPGIVAVHTVGEAPDGRPFYAMPLLEGETLQVAIERLHREEPMVRHGSLALRRLLTHFVAVCRTIAYAHRRKVIHRDLKPDNIMIGRFGETYVLDWGLACPVKERVTDGVVEKTLIPFHDRIQPDADRGIGTPAYMSPEQISGDLNLGPASDIYSLGATLYKLLTGRTSFEEDTLTELRQKVLSGRIPRPTQLRRGVPRALEAICLKAMARYPQQRYATASALADDIENYLADAPVSTFRESLSQKIGRWERRHRLVVRTILASLAMLLLVVVLFSLWMLRTAQREHAAREQGLRGRAALAAHLLSYEIDRRWWHLEAAARDGQLVELVQQFIDRPEDQQNLRQLNAWLANTALRHANDMPAHAWFINAHDGRGTQVARYPYYQDEAAGQRYPSIGRAYAQRDYFHGLGPAPLTQNPSNIQPIRHPHLAAPFTGTHQEMVIAFSVPIWLRPEDAADESRRPLGVLGMAVPLGELTALDDQLEPGQFLTLIYLRTDRLDGQQTRRGLVMHHSGVPRDQAYQPYWIEGTALLDALDEAARGAEPQALSTTYDDPLRGVYPVLEGNRLAACAAVQIKSRRPPLSDTGWMVVLQERQ